MQIYSDNVQSCQDRTEIEFSDLCYQVPASKERNAKKLVLQCLNGKFCSGRLTAIMGPSGAGKTTLLNILSGFKLRGVSGSILVNENERNVQEFRKKSCYIKQDFAMLELLTATETMMFAAELKLGSEYSRERKIEMIRETLELLGLEKTMDTMVEKLSGGEQKRLSIAVELLTNPPIMFFDEPTSGLDSLSTVQVMSHLKLLAQGGRTVICTIHQPSSRLFQMFDDLYLLADGQCLYSGPISNMMTVFEETGLQCPNYYNRADFAIEVACGERGGNVNQLIEKFGRSSYNSSDNQHTVNSEKVTLLPHTTPELKEIDNQVQHGDVISFWKQFSVLLKRSFMYIYRNKVTFYIQIVIQLLVGLLFGSVYYDVGNDASKITKTGSCIFFYVYYLFCANAMLGILVVPREIGIVLRELLNNWYSLQVYCLTRVFAEIPLQIFCTTLVFTPGYMLAGHPTDGTRMIQFWFICLMVTLVGHVTGLVIGSFTRSSATGMTVLCAVTSPAVLLSGFFLNLRYIPIWLNWITYVNFFRYALEGLFQSVYGYNRPNMNCDEIYCYFQTPRKFLEEMEMADAEYRYDVTVLAVWIILLLITFYSALKWRIHHHQ